jgi:hypothetical protein
MPDLSYQIQLTSIGSNSGPYYNVTFTTASTFFPVLTGTPAFLPTTNSIANVTIPSGSFDYLAFNLDNGVDPCGLCDYDITVIVTGSAPTSSCCTPTLDSVTPSGSFVNVAFTLPLSASCLSCYSVTIQTSTNGTTWGNDSTGVCTSPRTINAPTASCTEYTTYYRLYQTCDGSVTSSFSNTGSYFISASGNICCTPTIINTQLSGSSTSSLFVNYSVTSDICCLTCSFVTLQTSSNGVDFGGDVTGSCVGSTFTIAAPACSTTGSYRLQQTCSGSVTSSYSAIVSFSNTCIPPSPVEYIIDIAANGTFVGACSGATTTVSVFAEPGNTVPFVGMILYDDNTLTNPFIGSVGWRKLVQGAISYATEVDINGEITNYGEC